MTALWVLWHRLRRHWVQRGGWMLGRQSGPIWECWTCYDGRAFKRSSQRIGWAPRFIEWKERG